MRQLSIQDIELTMFRHEFSNIIFFAVSVPRYNGELLDGKGDGRRCSRFPGTL